MTRNGHRLLGLLGLVLVVACDDGGSANREAKKAATPPVAKAAPAADGAAGEAPPKTATPTPAEDPTPSDPDGEAPDEAADGGEPAADGGEVVAADGDGAQETADAGTPDSVVDGAEPLIDDEPEEPPPAGATALASGYEVNDIALGGEAELLRLVLAHDVESRQPVDPATSFPAGHKVNLFVEARNETEEELQVQVVWETVSSGRRTPATTVRIPTRKLHRTRAYRTMRRPGEYRVIVLGEDERELAIIPFTIE